MSRDVIEVTPWRDEGGALVVELAVPRDLVFFEGHFPGRPVLSGVVQLDRIVLPRIEARWPDIGVLRGLRLVKFHQPIEPGDGLVLRLERRGPAQVVFHIERRSAPCASGVLEFAPV